MIVRYILDLNLQGFAPTLGTIQDIIDKLLAVHNTEYIGKNWPINFIKRTDCLIIQFN